MKQMINILGMLYFSCLLLAIGNNLNNFILPLRMNQFGFDESWIGITMSANAVGLILGCLIGRKLVERIGYVRTFVMSCAIFTGVVLSYSLWMNAFFWMGLRIIGGFFTATAYLVVESWINENSSTSNRGRVLGTYLVIHYSGSAIGQLMVNLDGPDPSQIFIISAIAIALSAAPVSFSIAPTPESYELESISIPELFRISPVGLAGVFAAGVGFGGLISMGPIFGSNLGWDVENISFFMAVMVIGSLLFQYPLGKASDAWDRRKILGLVQVMGLISLLGLQWAVSNAQLGMTPIWIIGLFLGGVVGSIYPMSTAVIFDWLRPKQMIAASGNMILTFALGSIAGPFLLGLSMQHLGAEGFLIYLGTVMGTLMLFILYRIQVRQALPVEAQENFVVIPRMPPVHPQLDPRIDPDYDATDPGSFRESENIPIQVKPADNF